MSGNPFNGYQIYANPYYSSEIYTSAIPTLSAAGKTSLVTKAQEVAKIGTFVWLYVLNISQLQAGCSN